MVMTNKTLARARPRRTRYSMYHNVATIGKIGTLTPILMQEVAPNDTWQGRSGMLLRFSPLKNALVQDVFVDVVYVYVPHRMVFADWETFWTEGPVDSPSVSLPTFPVNAAADKTRCLFWREHSTESNKEFNALRLYAYNLAFNELFRHHTDAPKAPADLPDTKYGHMVSYKKEYWTSLQDNLGVDQNEYYFDTNRGSGSQASAKDVLEAVARQKIELRKAQYGTRYIDNLRAMGVNINYQMLQRPEVVAIHRTMVNITDVVNTSDTNLGHLAGHAISGSSINLRRKTFPEHGTLLGFVTVRPTHMRGNYNDWFDIARDYSSFYDPGQVLLPPVEIQRRDVYPGTTGAGATNPVGYQPWGDWYRSAQSKVHQDLTDWSINAPAASDDLGPASAENLRNFDVGTGDSVFDDITDGHYQVALSHRLRANRLIPKQGPALHSGVGGQLG